MESLELLKVEEAAKIFRVPSSTVRTWIYRKQLPDEMFIRIGNTIRVKKKQMNDFIESGKGI